MGRLGDFSRLGETPGGPSETDDFEGDSLAVSLTSIS